MDLRGTMPLLVHGGLLPHNRSDTQKRLTRCPEMGRGKFRVAGGVHTQQRPVMPRIHLFFGVGRQAGNADNHQSSWLCRFGPQFSRLKGINFNWIPKSESPFCSGFDGLKRSPEKVQQHKHFLDLGGGVFIPSPIEESQRWAVHSA